MPSLGDTIRIANHREWLAYLVGTTAARWVGMHHAHEELQTLSEADLVATMGGFMQFVQQAMGMAGQMVNQFGDDKAKAGFGMAQNIVGSIGGMLGGMGG